MTTSTGATSASDISTTVRAASNGTASAGEMTTAAYRIGIDANTVVDAETGALAPHAAAPAILAESGAGWVRLRFSVRPWTSINDETQHAGHTWSEAYRSIVDRLRAEGMRIYGAISHDILSDDPGDALRNAPAIDDEEQEWLARYTEAFVAVVEGFHPDVEIFESFEEPDDWHGSQRNWLHPGWYAVMLQRIYDEVRARPNLTDVRLVSGPLQGLSVNNNAAATYLRTAYRQGERRFGWGQDGTPVPFDGVGYHLYIVEEHLPDETPAQAHDVLRREISRYLSGMRRTIQQAEGRAKPIYISAMGWNTNRNPEAFQETRLRQAYELLLAQPDVQLGVWNRLQDAGPADGNQYYGLYRPGALSPENRKPAYAALQELCGQPLPTTATSEFDNRTLIKAVTLAARESGQSRYPLIDRGNLWGLFLNRAAPYRGPSVDALPGLAEVDRNAIRNGLVALLSGAQQNRGEITAGPLNLRAGPGTDHAILDQLPAQASVLILQDKGEWLRIEAQGKEGFVHRDFVALPDEQLPNGYLCTRQDLSGLTLEPPPDRRINAATVQTPSERLLAFIWNEYGRLLTAVADELHVDPAVAEAVVAVESGGKCFAGDGRMIIRFENHLFHRHWGEANPERFSRHFQFDAGTPWQGHRWRPSEQEAFRDQHAWQGSLDANQQAEWEVFNFAASLDPRAARLSISMGAPQILGSNYPTIGYESVEQMFDAFAESAHAQLLGFFDFIKASPQRVTALQRRDYRAFAEGYNGPGQADHYGPLIEQQVQAFDELLARQDAVSFGAPAEFEIDTEGLSFLPPIWPQPDATTRDDTQTDEDSEVDAKTGADAARDADSHITTVVDSERLREAWEDYMVEGLENTNRMFDRTLNAYMVPYYLTVSMYIVLFIVGVGLFVTAAWLAARGGSEVATLIFAGLGTLTFVAIFIRYPLRALEENLQFITWQGLIYNTYWTQLLYMQDPDKVQEELAAATQKAIEDLERLIDKNAALAEKRPGAGSQDG